MAIHDFYFNEGHHCVNIVNIIKTIKQNPHCTAVAKKQLIVPSSQHADDGYSRHGNVGASRLRNMVLIYLPDGTNVYGSRGREFEKIGSVKGIKSCKIMFLGGTSYSLIQTRLL